MMEKTTTASSPTGPRGGRHGILARPCLGCGATGVPHYRGKKVCVECHRAVSRGKWRVQAALAKLRERVHPELMEFLEGR